MNVAVYLGFLGGAPCFQQMYVAVCNYICVFAHVWILTCMKVVIHIDMCNMYTCIYIYIFVYIYVYIRTHTGGPTYNQKPR